MKKTKKLLVIISLLLILLILTSCQNRMIQEPAIKVLYNSNELKAIHYLDRNNKDKGDIEEGIKNVMVGKRFVDLPMIDFGEKVEIEALNFETAEFEVYDYIVDECGNIISDYDVEPFIITSVNEGKAEFVLEDSENLENYRDYWVEGKPIHCLLFTSEINTSSFAFGTLVLSNGR